LGGSVDAARHHAGGPHEIVLIPAPAPDPF